MLPKEENSSFSVLLKALRHLHYSMFINLSALDIYPGQPQLLFILNSKDGQSHKELSEKTFLKPATITKMLKKMEKSQLITRMRDKEDKRILRVYLTDKGRELCKGADKVFKSIEAECFKGFTEEDNLQFRKLLNKIIENIDKGDGFFERHNKHCNKHCTKHCNKYHN